MYNLGCTTWDIELYPKTIGKKFILSLLATHFSIKDHSFQANVFKNLMHIYIYIYPFYFLARNTLANSLKHVGHT